MRNTIITILNDTLKPLQLHTYGCGLHIHFRVKPPARILPQSFATFGTDHREPKNPQPARVSYCGPEGEDHILHLDWEFPPGKDVDASGFSNFFHVETTFGEGRVTFIVKSKEKRDIGSTSPEAVRQTLKDRALKVTSMEEIVKATREEGAFKVVAIYDYPTKETGFLELHNGDVITVLDNTNYMWWYGDLNGKLGYFPPHLVYGGDVKFVETPLGTPVNNDKETELCTAIAACDFEGTAENELSFKKGNIIFLIDDDPKEEWWEGGIDKKTGYFPKTYVVPLTKKKLEDRSDPKEKLDKSKRALVLYDFQSTEESELSLVKGSIIAVHDSNHEEEWWEGEFEGNIGFFPKTYVDLLTSTDNPSTKLREAIVLYDFEGTDPSELTVHRAYNIYILENECDLNEEWWEGHTIEGKHGFVPQSFVQLKKLKPKNEETLPSRLKELDDRNKRKVKEKTKNVYLQSRLDDEMSKNAVWQKKVNELLASLGDSKHIDKDIAQRLKGELHTEQSKNHNLTKELREYEKTVPALKDEISLLKKDLSNAKEVELQMKSEINEFVKVASAFKDTDLLIALERERNQALKDMQQFLVQEVSALKQENLKIMTSQENFSQEAQSIIDQLQQKLTQERGQGEVLEKQLRQTTCDFRIAEMKAAESEKLNESVNALTKELADTKYQFQTLKKKSEEQERKRAAAETRTYSLLKVAEDKCSELEAANLDWKKKYLDLEFRAAAQGDEIALWVQKYNLEVMNSKTLEDKITELEEYLEDKSTQQSRDSITIYNLKLEIQTLNTELKKELQLKQNENKGTPPQEIKIETKPENNKSSKTEKTEITSESRSDNVKNQEVRASRAKGAPTRIVYSGRQQSSSRLVVAKEDSMKLKDEEEDEESRDSFRRARMFFAAQERAVEMTKPKPRSNSRKT